MNGPRVALFSTVCFLSRRCRDRVSESAARTNQQHARGVQSDGRVRHVRAVAAVIRHEPNQSCVSSQSPLGLLVAGPIPCEFSISSWYVGGRTNPM